MLSGPQGAGWYLRKTRDHDRLGAFYRDVIGLPILRHDHGIPVFWLGGTTVMGMGPLPDSAPEQNFKDRSEAPLAFVLRVDDIDKTLASLRSHGVRIIMEPLTVAAGTVAYFLDPDGNATGILQCSPTSPLPEDAEALRRGDRESTIPDAPSMPAGWRGIARIVLRCTNLQKEVAFYRDVIGLTPELDQGTQVLFSLGATCAFEIAIGAPVQPEPTDRADARNAFVLRVADVEQAAAELADAGVRCVNPPFDIGGGRVAYYADPENHVFGVQQRWETSMRPEDVEVRRRLALGELPV